MRFLDTGLQVALVVLGVLVARAALTTARTPQGASAWVMFLVSFPHVAIPAFAVFGGVSRYAQTPDDRHAPRPEGDDAPGRLSDLRDITRVPLRDGNDLTLLTTGRKTFDAILAAIDAAEREVAVQFFIIRADALGLALQARLIAAARRGVRVRVLCDLVGSFRLGLGYGRALRAAGVELRGIPGPPRGIGRIGVNFRNHRKAVVVDGRLGFVGGYNVGQEYIDGGAKFDLWRDTHLRIEGPMAAQLRDLFAADWEAVTGDALEASAQVAAAGDCRGLVTGVGPTDRLERGSLLLCGLVGLARRRLWIASPYLVPHTDLLTALQLAALRGVEVRILIPRPSDHVLTWYASRGYARMLMEVGIEVREYLPGFMHSKVMLIDDDVASVGTINFDIRSALLNFEETALVEGRDFAARVEAMLAADFAQSTPLAKRMSWDVRLLSPVARLFGPVL